MDAYKESPTLGPRVIVVGSYNIDMTIKAARLPRPGETIIGGRFHSGPGGKGANQAVAAARAGAAVQLIARVGDDTLGGEAIRRLQAEGVETQSVARDPDLPTGTAWILVDAKGENSIVVASGANAALSRGDIARAEESIADADILLAQLECPVDTVEYAFEIAARHNVTSILNPAPMVPLSADFLRKVTVITPNEIETEMLTGVTIDGPDSLSRAADVLLLAGTKVVVITLGSKGAYVATRSTRFHLPAFAVDVVDSTAAGDVFNGCLAAFLAGAHTLNDAVRAAAAAAAMSVTKLGAQDSAPSRESIMKFLRSSPLVEETNGEL